MENISIKVGEESTKEIKKVHPEIKGGRGMIVGKNQIQKEKHVR